MLVPSQKYVRNRLLSSISPDDYEALRGVLEHVSLRRSEILVRSNEALRHVHFLEDGIISVVATTPEGRRIEVGLIGREGFVGTPVLLDVASTPHELLVQLDSEALRLDADTFRTLVEARPSLRSTLMRYAHVFQVQAAQTALSNGSYSLEERLARWLLMCHDRVIGDEFPVTHEFLSVMLGVRRPGVTTSVHVLEGAGMIKARRSRIEIVDRAKLERAAGDSYGVVEAEYARLFGPLP